MTIIKPLTTLDEKIKALLKQREVVLEVLKSSTTH